METFKKVALHLHGLSDVDCQWLMSRLPERHRVRLLEMLDELKSLGIPKEPGLLASIEVEQAHTNNEAMHNAKESPEYIQNLDSASAEHICNVLSKEHDNVIAIILASHDWNWHDRMLHSVHEPRRRSILSALANVKPVSETTRKALLNALMEAVSTHYTTNAAAVVNRAFTTEKKRGGWRKFGKLAWQT